MDAIISSFTIVRTLAKPTCKNRKFDKEKENLRGRRKNNMRFYSVLLGAIASISVPEEGKRERERNGYRYLFMHAISRGSKIDASIVAQIGLLYSTLCGRSIGGNFADNDRVRIENKTRR